MDVRYCRICGNNVTEDDAWVELNFLGRFWLCPTHNIEPMMFEGPGHMWMYLQGNTRFVLGPYPYEQRWTWT